MAKGKGKKKAARHRLQQETPPVKDRSQQDVASRDASPRKRVVTGPSPAAIVDDSAAQTSSVGIIETGRAVAESPPSSPTTTGSRPEHSATLLEGSKGVAKSIHCNTEDTGSAGIDHEGPFQRIAASRSTSSRPTSCNSYSAFTPTENLDCETHQTSTTIAAGKRDSVISTTWEEARVGKLLQVQSKQASRLRRWHRGSRPHSWWPCRLYRWFRVLVIAISRGFQSSRWLDFIVTSGLLLACVYVAYYAMDFVFTGLIKGVSAQELIEAANCSVVYVTIPGPIITVSLIAASPTDPARGTYYYSVINGTTEWLNSVAPPSRSSAFATPTSPPAPGSSSPQSSMPVPVLPPSTITPTLSTSVLSGIGTTLTTTIISGDLVMVSTVTLLPSTISITSAYPSSTAPLSSAPIATGTSLLETTGTNSLSYISPSPPNPISTLSTTNLFSDSAAMSTSPSIETTKEPTGSVGPPGLSSSSYNTLLPPGTSASGFATVSNTVVVITSIIPGGSTTVLTITSVTSIVASPSIFSSGFGLPPTLSSSEVPTNVPPGGTTIQSTDPALPPGVASSTSSPVISSSSVPAFLTTMTRTLPDGQTTVIMVSTNSPSPSPITTAPVTLSSISLVTTLITVPEGITTLSTITRTTFISVVTSTQVASSSFNAPGESSQNAASSTSTISSGHFTVSLPGPVIGSGGSDFATTITRLSSGPATSLMGSVSLTPTSRSTAVSDRPASTTSTSITRKSSVSLSGSSSSSSTMSLSSSTLTSAFSSLASSSLIKSGDLTTSSLSLPDTSVSSRPFSTRSPVSLTVPMPSRPFPSGAASSSLVLSSKSSSLTPTASSLTSIRFSASTSGAPPTLPSLGTSSVSTSMLDATSSSSSITIPPATVTTTLVGSFSSTASSSTSSPSSFASASNNVPPFLTTTLSALNTSLGSSSASSVSWTGSASNSLSSSQSLSLLSSGTAGSISSSTLPSSIMGSTQLFPGAPSTVFLNTTSMNTSSTVSSTSLSFSTSLLISSSVSISGMSSTTVASSAVLSPPTGPDSNSSSTSLFSASSTIPTSSVSSKTAPVVVTSAPISGSNTTSTLQLRALMTKIVSYGDASVVFVFPTPTIVTTQSYWTGTYPTVTGPEPSELQTISSTTRSIRQTPLSELPSFELFTTASRFTTGTDAAARAAAIPTDTDQQPPAEPTKCGESGNFTLSFDDTTVGSDGHDVIIVNGMKNPYHHLFYANGYTYVPDKWEPYPAVSQPNVAMFLPLTGRLLPNTPFAGTLLPGEIGAGPRASVTAYWFNAYSGFFGCALSGLTPCTLRISGYRYDAVLQAEVLVVEQNATLPACYAYVDCKLTRVVFNDQFKALSGIRVNAFTPRLGIPQVHMMDDLQLGWWNDTCAAGIWRIGHL